MPAPTVIQVTDTNSLNQAIKQVNGAATGAYEIVFANNVSETATLDSISLKSGVSLTIEGNGSALDGGGIYRGLYVASGTVSIQDLIIRNATATGAQGQSGGGGGDSRVARFGGGGKGGGAGLGGGLFIGAGANVTLADDSFSHDRAVGGAGGDGGVIGEPGSARYGNGAGTAAFGSGGSGGGAVMVQAVSAASVGAGAGGPLMLQAAVPAASAAATAASTPTHLGAMPITKVVAVVVAWARVATSSYRPVAS